MLFEDYKQHLCRHLSFDFATEEWQLASYWNIRRKVFCEEQELFTESDRDPIDEEAIHIMATCFCMGMQDRAVGTVRIYEKRPRVWYGGRLAVEKEFRSLRNFNSVHLFPVDEPYHLFTVSVGAALIFKAVSTANALGCDRFWANVQPQNVNFFKRLHWNSTGKKVIQGIEHEIMEADLEYYPPSVYVNHLGKQIA